tara:strand:- start:48 stop:239 length:192 start_codon:yes stop_codon:yes gene_type:complete
MLIKRNLAVPFYVQDERYDVMAWMPMNVYVQDERDGMDGNESIWNVYVQDERKPICLGFLATP